MRSRLIETSAETKGSRRHGQLRAAKILEEAQIIFSEEGYHSLTLRNIAKRMGISNGNVTYYYANKRKLFHALISNNLARYEEAYSDEVKTFPDDPKARIEAHFSYLVKDAQSPKSHRFFYQLWALSSNTADVAQQRDEVYKHFFDQVSNLMSLARPELSNEARRNKSVALMALIEGLNVLYGSGAALSALLGLSPKEMVKQAMDLAYA